MAAALAGRSGRRSATTTCRPRSTGSFGFPGADDLGNMFQFKRDFETDYFAGARAWTCRARLNPELQTFDQWLARNKGRIPLE